MPLYLISHIVLMSAMVLLVTAGVTIAKVKPKGWYQIHPKLSGSGFILGGIGILIVFVQKQIDGRGHFVLPHEQIGLVAILLMFTVALTGIFMRKLPKQARAYHKIVGWIALILSIVVVIMGIQLVL